MSEDKKCWACKRTLVGDSKLGLCPKCINKYGTPAVGLIVLGLGVAGRQVVKHSDVIVKVIGNIFKK